MKILFTTLICAFVRDSNQQVVQDPAYKALNQASTTACIQETGVDPKIIYNIWTQPDFPANNKPLQCYLHCMHIKMGILDANGKLNSTELMKISAYYADAEEVKEIGDKCDDIVPGSDPCEYGYLLSRCAAQIELD